MKIISMQDPIPEQKRVIVLGFFDGMHLGHTALFSVARQEAARLACRATVFSFRDDGTLKPKVPRLLPENERLARMEQVRMDEAILFDFAAIRAISPEDFVKDILLRRLCAAAVVCGYNFRFGAGGVGDAAQLSSLLAAAGVPLITIPACCLGKEPISASAIRTALAAGDAEKAARMLGRPYTISGVVCHGRALGRTIGVPTANLPIQTGMMVPAHGVYAVVGQCEGIAQPLSGIANIGTRPTVEAAALPNCEAHFFSPVGDIYGKRLTVSLLHYLRGEQTFENFDALRRQIACDAAKAKEYTEPWLNGQN